MHQITCSRDSEQMNSRSEKEREEKRVAEVGRDIEGWRLQ